MILESCFHAIRSFYCQMVFPAVNMRHAYTGTQGQLQPHKESTAAFYGLPNIWNEQQQLEISSTADSLQQKGSFEEVLKEE